MKTAIVILSVMLALSSACQTSVATKQIDLDEGEGIAIEQLEGGVVVAGTQAIDLGRLVYIYLVQNHYEARRVIIDAKTAQVIDVRDKTDVLATAVENGNGLETSIIPLHREAAEAAALETAPGYIRKWQAKKEDGRFVFVFKVRNGIDKETRVTVDGFSYQILDQSEEGLLD